MEASNESLITCNLLLLGVKSERWEQFFLGGEGEGGGGQEESEKLKKHCFAVEEIEEFLTTLIGLNCQKGWT